MTNQQKQLIETMRKQGISYIRIAESLGVSENTIKSYCQRNNLGGIRAGSDTRAADVRFYCKQCGTRLNQVTGHKPRKFCSDSCRLAWWKSHPERIEQKAIYTFSCSGCGEEFTAYGNTHRKYCSHACYIASRFANKTGAP